MIKIGTKVKLLRDVVLYRDRLATQVLARIHAGTEGVVRYRPKDEDPNAFNELGVTWNAVGGQIGVEVQEADVQPVEEDVSYIPLDAIKRLLNHSLGDIGYEYAALTDSERRLVSPEAFAQLVSWLKAE